MTLARRSVLKFAVGSAAISLLESSPLKVFAEPRPTKIKAIAFDGFPIFDPRPIAKLAEELYPGQGADLSNEWRTRQFEYTWLRTLSRTYVDFWQVTQEALTFSANKMKLDLTPQKTARLMNAYLKLKTWPDVIPALKTMKDMGLRLAFLSNLTPKMLHAGIENSGLNGTFEHILSTDQVQAFKPDPRAYQMGVDALNLKRDEILFAAFADWDAAGAKAFGYPTFWVNRLNAPPEELGVHPDASGANLNSLVDFLKTIQA